MAGAPLSSRQSHFLSPERCLSADIRYTNYDCTDILSIIGQSDVDHANSDTDLRTTAPAQT
jgi:hypothetical protein